MGKLLYTGLIAIVLSMPIFSCGGGNEKTEVRKDTTPPIISDIRVKTAQTSADISWTTDESANSTVVYGETTDYGKIKKDDNYVTSHSVNLDNLLSNTTYYYKISSKDNNNNEVTSGNLTFKTAPESYNVFVDIITKDLNGIYQIKDNDIGETIARKLLGNCENCDAADKVDDFGTMVNKEYNESTPTKFNQIWANYHKYLTAGEQDIVAGINLNQQWNRTSFLPYVNDNNNDGSYIDQETDGWPDKIIFNITPK